MTKNRKKIWLMVFIAMLGFRVLESRTPNTRYGRVFAHIAEERLLDGNDRGAKRYFLQARRSDPTLSMPFYGLGFLHYGRGEWQPAYDALLRAVYLSEGVEVVKAYSLLGIVSHHLGHYERATFYMGKAIFLGHYSRPVQYFFNLGMIHYLNGRPDLAQRMVAELWSAGSEDYAQRLQDCIDGKRQDVGFYDEY